MIENHITKQLWDEIEKEKSNAIEYKVRSETINNFKFFLIRKFPENQKAFGIALTKNLKIAEKLETLSSISIEKFTYGDSEILAIFLVDETLEDVFDEFIKNLFDLLTNTNLNDLEKIFLEKINSFLRLFEKNYEGLKKYQIRGLFAELDFLELLIIKNVNSAIDHWKGPINGLHDFVFKDFSFEIKSKSIESKSVNILNTAQLDPNKNGQIYLLAIPLEQGTIGKNIIDKILTIIELLSKPDQKKFISLLNDAGYMESHNSKYRNWLFKTFDYQIYDIKNDFPSKALLGLPDQILDVKYELDLSLCDQWKIKENQIKFIEKIFLNL